MKLHLFLLLLHAAAPRSVGNPQAPKRLTWEVINPTGRVIWKLGPVEKTPGTWWPTLTPDVCQLALGVDTWDIPHYGDPNQIPLADTSRYAQRAAYGCGFQWNRCKLHYLDFYVCPRDGRTQAQISTCGGPESLYCKAWGCETTGEAYWKPTSSWDWITVKRPVKNRHSGNVQAPHGPCGNRALSSGSPTSCHNTSLCNPLKIDFTASGKKPETVPQWLKGRTWGLRFYGISNFGLWFTLRLRWEDLPKPVGPNPVLRPPPGRLPPRIPNPVATSPAPDQGSRNVTPTPLP